MCEDIKLEGFGFVENENKLSIPLYKYFSKIEYALDSIQNHRVHLEDPHTYNDLYDCRIALPEDIIERINKLCIASENFYTLLQPLLGEEYSESLKEYADSKESNTNLLVKDYIDFLADNKGFNRKEIYRVLSNLIKLCSPLPWGKNKVSCFSEYNDSILMWAYYANAYKGVCIQYDVASNSLLQKICHKVQYTDHFNENHTDSSIYYRKSRAWEHEQEWRIVCSTEKDFVPDIHATAIYISSRTLPEFRDSIIETVQNEGIDLYVVFTKQNKYELDFLKIIDHGVTIEKNVYL